MNHCVTKGCGRRCQDNAHCLICQTAALFRGWRYVSPSMRRWREKATLQARAALKREEAG